MKRLISMALVLCMVLSMLPVGAFAADDTSSTAATTGSQGLNYALSDDGNSYIVTGIGSCTDTEVIIPATYEGKPVTEIGNEAFQGCMQLTNVVLPDSITTIGEWAFAYSPLTAIEIPNSVTHIGRCAFNACDLVAVHLPASLATMGDNVFMQCRKLTQFTVDENNTVYCAVNGVLYSKDMTTLIIYPDGKPDDSFSVPSDVKMIGDDAFRGADFSSVTLPEGLQMVGDLAFFNCCNLTSITIPSNVTKLGHRIFGDCYQLAEVLVAEESATYCSENGVLYTKEMSVLICYPLGKTEKSFEIPHSVTIIDQSAFHGCLLSEIVMPDGLTSIGDNAFFGCANLTSVTIPDSVTSIRQSAFCDAGVTSVKLSAGLNVIEWRLFGNCANLTTVTIPISIKSIEADVFNNCQALEEIRYAGAIQLWAAIEKGADWDRNTGDYVITCSIFCDLGHTWAEASCSAPKTCVICGVTEGDALGHNYEDDICGRCGRSRYSQGLTYIELTDKEGNVIGYGVSGIGSCTDTDLVIPATYNGLPVTAVTSRAFWNCAQLTSVELGENLVQISYGAFWMCENLTSVTISAGVRNIGREAFPGCQKLSQFVVDEDNPYYCAVDGVLYTEDMKTLKCYPAGKQDKRFEIPQSVTEIESNAFLWGKMYEVILPKGLAGLKGLTFQNCQNLESITIPVTVTCIESDAFSGCHQLTQILYGGTEAAWQQIAVYDALVGKCKVTYAVFCTDGHTMIDATCIAPKQCFNCGVTEGDALGHNYEDDICSRCGRSRYSQGLVYTEITDTEGNLIGYSVADIGSCTDAELVIPATYNGLPVIAIGERAFAYIEHKFTSVILPDTIRVIGIAAFEGCWEMTSIHIPESVTCIEYAAFWGCEKLTSLYIPANVTNIGPAVFAWCAKLVDLTVDEKNPAYCVVDGVLYNKDKTVLVAYLASKSDQPFVIPTGVTTIAESAFECCQNLTEIILPDTLATIEAGGFQNCANLTGITIPASVTYIGDYVFENCDSLAEIIVEKDNQKYRSQDGVLYDLDMTELICYPAGKQGREFIIPTGVTSIVGGGFRGCQFESVVIPEGVTNLNGFVFNYCNNLKQVHIPVSVTYIGNSVFNQCKNMTDIYYAGSYVQWIAIEKAGNWDWMDGKGTVGNFTIHYGIDCNVVGHSWVEATCTAPKLCINCGLTEGDLLPHSWKDATCSAPKTCAGCGLTDGKRLPHQFADGACVNCHCVDYDGKIVKIYFPWNEIYLITEPNGKGLFYSDSDGAAIWVMDRDDNDYYTFSCDGQYLTSGPTGNSLFLTAELSDCGRWELIDLGDGTCYLRNVGAAYKGSYNQYLQFYRGWFTTYGFNADNAQIYTFQLSVLSACEAYGHSWTDATCKQERFCTVCKISGGMGKHNYVDGVCAVCGVELFSEGLVYTLAADGKSYIVSGIGSCTDTDLFIPASYEGLPVTTIGMRAFQNCSQLTSVNLPASVTVIEDYAFSRCQNLRAVHLSEGLKSICWHAFSNCNNLSQVEIPSTVMLIEGWAFAYSGMPSSIHIPNGVTNFAAFTFTGCTNLQQVTVDDDHPAFSTVDGVLYSKNMKTLLYYPTGKTDNPFVVPDTVTLIESQAFVSCGNLTAIELPEGLLGIGWSAFSGCHKLASINIPGTVTNIQAYAFESCQSLTSITIPASVIQIGFGAFQDCNNLTEIRVDENNTAFCAVDGVVYSVDRKTLIAYPAGREGNTFTVPSGVEEIYSHAFQGANNLTEVILPHGLTRINSGAFQSCGNLQKITIPVTLSTIGGYVFGQCRMLTEICYGGTEESWKAMDQTEGWDDGTGEYQISYSIFCGEGHSWVDATCDSPKSCLNCGITEGDPKGHTFVDGICSGCGAEDHGAVVNCGACGGNMTWTLYEDGLLHFAGDGDMYDYGTEIGYTPWFEYADQVKSVEISDGITNICHFAFADCVNLTTIMIPSSVGMIGYNAFDNCTSLQSIVLMNLHYAYTPSFNGCTSLTEIYLLDARYVAKNPYGFFDSIGLTDYAEHLYMPASMGGCDDAFTQAFSCTTATQIVDIDGVSYIMYTKADHKLDLIEDVKPTCNDDGYTRYQCADCGFITTKNHQALGHSYDSNYICSSCDDAPDYLIDCKLTLDDLTLGEDGVYYTADGHMAVIAVNVPFEWANGTRLTDYVNEYGEAFFSLTYWEKLVEATNSDGYAPLTKDSLIWILDVITGNPAWGEDESYLTRYIGIHIDRTHVHEYTPAVTKPTCTEPGYTTYTCSCEDSYIDDEVPALGHTEEIIPGKEATCTETGLTAGKKCSACGETTVKQTEIPARGIPRKSSPVRKLPVPKPA